MSDPQVIEAKAEVVAPADDKLVKYAVKTGLEKSSTQTLVEAFRPVFLKAREAIANADGVAASVKDATCVREIKKSRACRLALRAVRLESDAVRKKQKEHALLYGRAVDGFHNILMADLAPVETALQVAEDIAERAEAARLSALKASREAELKSLLLDGPSPLPGDLSLLSEADWARTVADAKLLRQAKIDAAAKAEAERLAREEEARRIAAENARLKQEAIAREAAAKAERESAEKKLESERAEAARVAAKIKADVDAAAKAAAAKAAKERAAAEAKAKAEREALEAKAREESAKVAKAQAELEAALESKRRAEAEAKEKADAEARAAELAARKAAAAPDKSKLKSFAAGLRMIVKPSFDNKAITDGLLARINGLAAWCDGEADKLP